MRKDGGDDGRWEDQILKDLNEGVSDEGGDFTDSESHISASSDASAPSSLGLEDISGLFGSSSNEVTLNPSTFGHSSFSFVPGSVSSLGASGGLEEEWKPIMGEGEKSGRSGNKFCGINKVEAF